MNDQPIFISKININKNINKNKKEIVLTKSALNKFKIVLVQMYFNSSIIKNTKN